MNIDRLSAFLRQPQVQGQLWRLCAASGFIGVALAKICHYLGVPVPDPDTVTMFLVGAIPMGTEWLLGWYRDNPNNMLRKLVLRINGTELTGATKAAVAEAVSNIPGVVVHVDTSVKSPAPLAVQNLAVSPAPDVVPISTGVTP
jgi:hypothetical protein